MRLIIFNGSPKKGINNTEVMLRKFEEGFKNTSENYCDLYKLNCLKRMKDAVDLFEQEEYILLAFPLYVYSMPSAVKEFIELLEPLCGKCKEKKVGFLVQYGFKEAIHARPLEKYLEKLVKSLDCEYLGTIIKGGCDNLSTTPQEQNKKILNGIYEIGKKFGETGKFERKLLDEYSKPETQTLQSEELMRNSIEFINKNYWGAQLKKNEAYDKRYARPYEKQLPNNY